MITPLLQSAREASFALAQMSEDAINDILRKVADAIVAHTDQLLAANQHDLDRMDPLSPLYDRLRLTPERIAAIADDMRHVATLPSPLGRQLSHTVLPNGLDLERVSVPFGVVGVVYEARPNVTFDVFALCLKSGNACVLKGGKDADETNRTAVSIIQQTLPHPVVLLPSTHEATAQLLHARGLVDLIIPRGGRRLIDFVRDEATVPVIETGAGVCHAYFDCDGDLEKGARIVNNAKTRRVSVCNALDCLLVHHQRIADLPALLRPLQQSQVIVHADPLAFTYLTEHEGYPARLLRMATADTYGTEFMDYAMALHIVADTDDALCHIRQYGSGHSECIITENPATADRFLRSVDAACVYHNAPTSFTDGAQFGLGAEIGISTQKLHARGPMALEALTTYKWIVRGNGQVRPK
ncbi:MAG: glutamate-5-semialdehyde dehydrogenase [Bacteroidales bacterium]|nr:glutamate-5-semialdehyde dehydrogenase [Bacteroidales bacterium]